MKNKDLEKYISILELKPDAKYILFVALHSGLSPSDLSKLELNEQFLDEIVMVDGLPRDVIQVIQIAK